MYYVRTEYINGRMKWALFSAELKSRGFGSRVEYNPGGWQDDNLKTVAPHVRFEDSDDALSFSLSTGQPVLKTVPYVGKDER